MTDSTPSTETTDTSPASADTSETATESPDPATESPTSTTDSTSTATDSTTQTAETTSQAAETSTQTAETNTNEADSTTAAAETTAADGAAGRGAIRSTVLVIGRLFGDATVLGLWVLLLVLLFLSTGWPWWQFYALLVLGVVLYVVVTPPWIRDS